MPGHDNKSHDAAVGTLLTGLESIHLSNPERSHCMITALKKRPCVSRVSRAWSWLRWPAALSDHLCSLLQYDLGCTRDESGPINQKPRYRLNSEVFFSVVVPEK